MATIDTKMRLNGVVRNSQRTRERLRQKRNLRISYKWVSTHDERTTLAQAQDREGDRTREWFSRYHNKRRQINAFGLESNQHYSDNSPPANTHLTLLGLILSTARTTSPSFLFPYDSHPLTSSSTLVRRFFVSPHHPRTPRSLS